MIVKYEYNIRDLNKSLSNGYGEIELEDPIMVYAQIPIEREQYKTLMKICKEQKQSIFDLLEEALDPDEIQFIF